MDSYNGTAGNDTFNSDVLTLTDKTVINGGNGGNGVDTLNASIIGNVAPTLNGVEKVFLEVLSGQSNVDASAFTGVQELWTRNSVGDLTVNGLASASTVIGIDNTEADVSVNYATSALQGNTTVTVALKGAAGNEIFLGADSASTTNEVNHVVLNSIGDVANVLQSIELADRNDKEAQVLTVTGTQALEIRDTLGANISVVNAGAMKGDLTLSAIGDADGLVFNGATMTGAASITVEAAAATNSVVVRTGSADDIIIVDDLRDVKLINGGAGDDKLVATVQGFVENLVVQAVETLELEFANGGLDAAAISGATKIKVTDVVDGGVAVWNMNASVTSVDVSKVSEEDSYAYLSYRDTVTGNLTMTTGATGNVAFEDVFISNVGALSIVNADNDFAAGKLVLDDAKTASVSVVNNAGSSKDVLVGQIENTGALTSVSVTAAGAGAAAIGDVTAIKLASLAVSATAGDASAGDIETEANLTVSLAAAEGTTASVGNLKTAATKDVTLTAVAASTGILNIASDESALEGNNVSVTATSATGSISVGDVTAAAAAALSLTSAEGALAVGEVAAAAASLTLTTAGEVTVGSVVATTAATLSLTGAGIESGSVNAATATVTLNSTDGAVNLGPVTVVNAAVVTVNAGNADDAGSESVSLGAIAAKTVALNITSAIDVIVTGGITATESAANTGRVIDVTLAGEGSVNLGALTAVGAGNTTSIDASALEGGLTVTLSAVQDTIKLGAGDDVITIANLTHSVLGKIDVISGFSVANDALIVGGIRIDGVDDSDEDENYVESSVVKLTGITELTAAQINAAFTAGNMSVHDVAYFTIGSRAFLAVNDSNAGFDATADALIEVTGMSLALGQDLFFTTSSSL